MDTFTSHLLLLGIGLSLGYLFRMALYDFIQPAKEKLILFTDKDEPYEAEIIRYKIGNWYYLDVYSPITKSIKMTITAKTVQQLDAVFEQNLIGIKHRYLKGNENN